MPSWWKKDRPKRGAAQRLAAAYCTGCPRHCQFSAPHCGRGAKQAAQMPRQP